MSVTTLLHSLYKYKEWSEEELFKCLKAPAAKSFPIEMEKALYWLAHINIVDQLFIASVRFCVGYVLHISYLLRKGVLVLSMP